VTNTTPFVNISDYPDIKELLAEIESLPHNISINADEIARQVKTPRSSNMVMLGAASPFIDIPYQSLENGIRKIFERKGDKVVQLNIEALKAGRDFSEAHRN
jgi:indolepyruvate ferredoxin oxidoreductase beta subunit